MSIIHSAWNCTGCSACFAICPQKCIHMECDAEGFRYPTIDKERCSGCSQCKKVCPLNTELDSAGAVPLAYAAYTKDHLLQMQSSSGGIFGEIASMVIRNGGVVCGAAFSDHECVAHIIIDNPGDLRLLQGSKYLQSNVGDSFRQIKQYLDQGRLVLFTGTPCQVEGLLNFLGHEYENLITQDIVCHGVPSAMVWGKYISGLQSSISQEITRINFRDKHQGWKNFSMYFQFSNGLEQRTVFRKDAFMKGFLANLYLRPSCYQCHFKTVSRRSDFTLADFWGVQKVCPEMAHFDGTSLVWVNTEKAKRIWDSLKSRLVCKEVKLEQALQYNSAATHSVDMPKEREKFFALLKEGSFEMAVRTVLPREALASKVLRKVRRFIKKALLG